jgi:hypothetical protein
LCHAEIENLRFAVGRDQDVGGLDVTMDNTPPMGVVEGLSDLQGNLERILGLDRHRRQSLCF